MSCSGTNNLVTVSNVVSPPPSVIAIATDPQLRPLQLNGDTKRTHALLPGSPAIAMGDNSSFLVFGQRGVGHPRQSGGKADIGAIQFNEIFANDFEV